MTDIVSLSACGSFKPDLPPGLFVLVDQFVDRTHRRESSTSSARAAWPMCRWPIRSGPALAERLAAAAEAEGVAMRRGGTYVCMEGPQFSSYAESMTYKGLGYDVIGMTAMPEAKLAREAEITYATLAMVTDFDCWHPEHDHVDVKSVIEVMHGNIEKARRIVARLAARFPGRAGGVSRRARTARWTTPS